MNGVWDYILQLLYTWNLNIAKVSVHLTKVLEHETFLWFEEPAMVAVYIFSVDFD